MELNELEPCKLGIKLQFLVSWTKQKGITADFTTGEVCESFVKPATKLEQVSYCELLLRSNDTAVGPPNAFISHAWNYRFLEVLDALTSYFAAEEDVIIWFDVFSHNQHTLDSLDTEWMLSTFMNAITSVGRTVMVLAPWNDPLPLQRGWCIWELYCTIEGKRSNGSCTFDVAMSSKNVDQFIADVEADSSNVIKKMLATIDTERSKCFKKEDKERIHEAIRQTVGFTELNKQIFETMRGWVISKYEARCYSRKELKDPHLFLAITCLAILHSDQGAHGKDLPLYEESYRMATKAFGEDHPNTFATKNNLALFYRDHGEYEKAISLLKDCLREKEPVRQATYANHLALVFVDQGKYKMAYELLESNWKETEDVLGNYHPDTWSCLNNLAGVLSAQGQYSKAFPLLKRCFKARQRILGIKHPDTLTTQNDLGVLFLKQRNYSYAFSQLQECLELRKEVLGLNHPDTFISINNLGALFLEKGEGEIALSLLQELVKMMKATCSESHPDMILAINNLANVYKNQGEHGKAFSLLENCLRDGREVFGDNHPHTLTIMNNLAGVYHTRGEYDKAVTLYEDCLFFLKEVNPTNSFTSMYSLSLVYRDQGKYEKSLLLLVQCYQGRRSVLGENHHDTLASERSLIDYLSLLITRFFR